MTLSAQATAAVAELTDSFYARAGQPGLACGIISGGQLAYARSLGEAWLGGPRPGQDTVFRIASMTKSFTAAAVLALRDDGALALDDPVARHLPELAGAPLPPGSPALTVRQLLTMTGGLPTDDPWGDRQQGLPLDSFAHLARQGLSHAWWPGTRFEYSNTGYALLGLVITAVSGRPYPDFVRDRLLVPLGMTSSGYHADGFPSERLARGYRRGEAGWDEVGLDPCGAYAPMGGLFTCVGDLARWVAGFVAAWEPGEGAGGHPLAAASRREMQSAQVVIAPSALASLPGEPVREGWSGYGMGLFTADDPQWGRLVGHSGGYPGFGSNMRWHPATGLGAVVLGNSTYAAASALAARLLDAVLRHSPDAAPERATAGSGAQGRGAQGRGAQGRGAQGSGAQGSGAQGSGAQGSGAQGSARGPQLAPAGPWPETVAARAAATGLLQRWDDATADELFAPNVAQDDPYPHRRHRAELLAERIGEFGEDPGRGPEHDSAAHCRWWLRGERGVVQAEILLTPEPRPRVQALRLAVPPAPGSPLAKALSELISLLNDGSAGWPAALTASPWLDTGLVVRRFRMAAGWAGRCTPGAYRAGDGETSATVELDGEHGNLALTVELDPASGKLHQAEVLLRP